MSPKYHKIRTATKFCQRICRRFFNKLNKQVIWLLRIIFRNARTQETGNSGFILPTVVLVSLIVVLVTTAILFRAFDRSKNASNVRLDEALVNASMPAVDRAKSKIAQLLNDPGLPRSTPSDTALYGIIKNVQKDTINTAYTFGDETPLELAFDINGNGTIDTGTDSTTGVYTIENDETLNTGWKFPVDTDNNGKFDTFTLYAIYFRSPPRLSSGNNTVGNTAGDFSRDRNGLEVRTPPMTGGLGGACATAAGTSAGLVGNSSWYQQPGGNLAKSFYVYTANVPISASNLTSLGTTNYEAKQGNRGFSSLEYEQDRFLAPVNNQAVWFQNDLELAPGTPFYINGAIHTNSNFLGGGQGTTVTFRQVSSAYSCYYSQQSALITIGGNFGTNTVPNSTDLGSIYIDLYLNSRKSTPTQDVNTNATIGGSSGSSGSSSTTSSGGSSVGYNDAAYNNRINLMTTTALNACTACASATSVANLTTAVGAMATATATPTYPSTLISTYTAAVEAANLSSSDVSDALAILNTQIQLYFSNRTRGVPFYEVSLANTSTGSLNKGYGSSTAYTSSNIFTNGSPVDVPFEWKDLTYTGLTLNTGQFPATNPIQLLIDSKQNSTGDRVFTGNGLPAYWQSSDSPPSTSNYSLGGAYVSGSNATQLVDKVTKWNNIDSSNTNPTAIRTRTSQIVAQLNLGVTDRGQFWEQSAAEAPGTTLANVGGMRIVTGAGIYVDDDGNSGTGNFPRSTYSFLPNPTLDPVVGGSSATLGFVCSSTATNCPVNSGGTSNTGQMPYPTPFVNAGTSQSNILVWPDTMPMTSPSSSLGGDLIMRATAVYHYQNNSGVAQTPIACVSSYYDPTNSTTAKNQSSLPWNNATGGKSNNGIVYSFPGRTLNTTTVAALSRQARLIFPNGSVANQPLQTAMQKYNSATNGLYAQFSYADYSAIDAAICSLGILNNSAFSISASPSTTYIGNGYIKESSFLDAREVKALQHLADYQNSSKLGTYGLTLEQRRPLEIRATDIDLTSLAATTIGGTSSGEYLLPNSGIIYATRDDAIADNSYATVNTSNTASSSSISTLSQTDFKLDPTRRPNAIRLINTNGASYGVTLARGGTNSTTYNSSEKGLILATNLPAYIKGSFNLHRTSATSTSQIQEFTDTQPISSTNWYTQQSVNDDFACRPNRPGCNTTTGDLWRPSTILADAVTILSDSFTDGFRSDGDFDLNRNYLSIPPANSSADLITYPNGLVNSLVTNASWVNTSSSTYAPTSAATASSYFANGVTPIQRRASFNEYLMESCNNIVFNCDNNSPSQWTVDGTNSASSLIGKPAFAVPASGTTAYPPTNTGYIRRVAFQRDSSGNLSLSSNGLPVPIGVTRSGANITVYAVNYGTSSIPAKQSGALWFQTTTSTANPTTSLSYTANNYLALLSIPTNLQSQPQLAPITQIFSPDGTPGGTTLAEGTETPGIQQNWIQLASTTSANTFNTGLAAGNSPSSTSEQSAGLQNFVRLLENWNGNSGSAPGADVPSGSGSQIPHSISGSFIQFKRSAYATAPFAPIITTTSASATSCPTGFPGGSLSIFGITPSCNYFTNKSNGTTPYYVPPARSWGFDVALLSQLPDLFAQQFTVPSSSPPTEYFRQVNSDDPWLQVLLCAKQPATGTTAEPFVNFAVPVNYLPSYCSSSPYTANYP